MGTVMRAAVLDGGTRHHRRRLPWAGSLLHPSVGLQGLLASPRSHPYTIRRDLFEMLRRCGRPDPAAVLIQPGLAAAVTAGRCRHPRREPTITGRCMGTALSSL